MRRAIFPFLLFLVSFGYSQNVLTLQEAIQTGLQNRFDIRIAQNQHNILGINNNYGNAGFYPIVFLQAGQNFNITNTQQEFFSGDVREGNNVNSNALNANAVLEWTFFDGMNMFIQKDRLEKEAERGLEFLQRTTEAAVLEIQLAYLDIQEIQDQIKIIQSAISISSERKNLTQTRVDIGSAAGQTLLQAQVDINSDSLELETAFIALRNAKIRLNQTLNRNPEIDFEIVPVALEVGLYDYNDMYSTLLNQNRDLSIARLNEKLANLQYKAVTTQQLPTLGFGAGYSFNRAENEIGILKFNRNSGLNYGLTARWNLFNGFRVRNQKQTARIDIENTQLSREQLEMDIKTNLFATIDQMNAVQNILRIGEKNVKVAEENVNITLDKLRIGSLIPLELRTAQQDLINSSFQLIIQQYTLKRLEYNLLFATGQLMR